MNKHNIKINFAHQTFKWSNEARGKAAVYCVIIGFALVDRDVKKIFQDATATGEPTETTVKQINAYLVDAPLLFIQKRNKPLCNVSEMVFGNMPNDGGNLLLNETEKEKLLKNNTEIKNLIRPFLGADEFVNNIPRYCIWLKDVSPSQYRHIKEIQERIQGVKRHRENSKREATKKLAEFPTLFGEIRHQETNYLLIPEVSTSKRKYIPVGFIQKETISSNLCLLIPNATLYEFGIVMSLMHMAWTKYVCGRLGNGYRYSASIVYNNFPWPSSSDKQIENIEKAAQDVLDTRAKFPNDSLAALYDPLTMPKELVKAHQKLDKTVEVAYGRSFDDDGQRVAYLFGLYQKKCGELFVEEKKRGKGRKR
jgi:hypothetical protein